MEDNIKEDHIENSENYFLTPEDLKRDLKLTDLEILFAQRHYNRIVRGKNPLKKIPEVWGKIAQYVLMRYSRPKGKHISWERYLGKALGCKDKKYNHFWNGGQYKDNRTLEKKLKDDGCIL